MIVEAGQAVASREYDLLAFVYYKGQTGIVKAAEVFPGVNRRQVDFGDRREWIDASELFTEEEYMKLEQFRAIAEETMKIMYGDAIALTDGQLRTYQGLIESYSENLYCRGGWFTQIKSIMYGLGISEPDALKLASMREAIAQSLENSTETPTEDDA